MTIFDLLIITLFQYLLVSCCQNVLWGFTLQVLATEFFTFAIVFVTLAIKFILLAIEFVAMAIEFVALA